MAKSELTTASVLAFERKIDPSDAILSAGRWDARRNTAAWRPIEIREKSIRGTISNRLKARDQDPARLDASIQSPNLQRVDVATLFGDTDTLKVRFTLRILGGTGIPSACNNAAYQSKLVETIRAYVDRDKKNRFEELAKRYATNIANARFLWRNRLGAENVEVVVSHVREGVSQKTLMFDALQFSLLAFSNDGVDELAALIADGLAGDRPVLLDIAAYARVGDGQEVFPSQELILDKGEKKGQKSKTLYAIGDVAAIHSQKIGNALRTIDTWYEGDNASPIAVEPYGSVTSQGKACRPPKGKKDFYSLLDDWVLRGNIPELAQQHFVVANLVRGGVFGEAEQG